MGCDAQNGLPVSMGKMHRHPLAQGLLKPQLPPQTVKLEPDRSWRAETVPAQRTAVTIIARHVRLRFFLNMASTPFNLKNG
jgi:hypothetical protein